MTLSRQPIEATQPQPLIRKKSCSFRKKSFKAATPLNAEEELLRNATQALEAELARLQSSSLYTELNHTIAEEIHKQEELKKNFKAELAKQQRDHETEVMLLEDEVNVLREQVEKMSRVVMERDEELAVKVLEVQQLESVRQLLDAQVDRLQTTVNNMSDAFTDAYAYAAHGGRGQHPQRQATPVASFGPCQGAHHEVEPMARAHGAHEVELAELELATPSTGAARSLTASSDREGDAIAEAALEMLGVEADTDESEEAEKEAEEAGSVAHMHHDMKPSSLLSAHRQRATLYKQHIAQSQSQSGSSLPSHQQSHRLKRQARQKRLKCLPSA